jgi:hypothetical protein
MLTSERTSCDEIRRRGGGEVVHRMCCALALPLATTDRSPVALRLVCSSVGAAPAAPGRDLQTVLQLARRHAAKRARARRS